MKILHCIPSFLGGGAERQLSILVPAQVAAGSNVHVAYIHPGPHLGPLQNGGAVLHRIRAAGNHDPRIAWRLWKLMENERPDIVHTWLPQMDIIGGLVALTKRIPWVMSERSCGLAYVDRVKDRLFRRTIGRRADAVVANSDAGLGLWRNALLPWATTAVVRNAVPLAEINAAAAIPRTALGVTRDVPIALFVGRLTKEKRLDLLLGIAEDVCRRSDAIFLICGSGPLQQDAQAFIRRAGLETRIRLLGHRSDVLALMKTADVLVSTSAFEGQPNVVLEAMAAGCPLVISDIPAHREFLNERLATMVALSDAGGFANAILNSMNSHDEARARASRAHEAISAFSPEQAAAQYNEVYTTVVRRKIAQ